VAAAAVAAEGKAAAVAPSEPVWKNVLAVRADWHRFLAHNGRGRHPGGAVNVHAPSKEKANRQIEIMGKLPVY